MYMYYTLNNFSVSDVALAIVQSEQWEDAMRMYNDYEELTPMKLLIKSMPGIHLFCWYNGNLNM